MRNFSLSALTIANVSGRLPERTSDTRFLPPMIATRSFCFRPFSSIRNLMAATGSGRGNRNRSFS